ncbi:HbrB-like-domain-containing protein [Infundibulicybe gibba]|nr:HbrB-like-domain-containing protein [Infundibulicybe gibba]
MLPAWASPVPRRSHDHSNPGDTRSLSSSDDGGEHHRRSSSDATPRQTPASTRFLSTNNPIDQDSNRNILSTSATDSFGASTSKRLGYLADKLSSSISGTVHSAAQKTSLNPSQLLHPHSHHSRVESALPPTSSSPSPQSMASSSSLSNAPKTHTSPSKASYGRTYDSKLVSREMHRLGGLPSGLTPQLSTAPSVTSLSLPPPSSMAQVNSSNPTADPWGALHVHVLPLFNGEPLRIPIEDLNILVKRHIRAVVSASPPKALAKLEKDASELISSGMVTLNSKLKGIDDERLLGLVVETWVFFWDQVLTYVEGVLLPLQTDALLSSLYRNPKAHHRAVSPNRQGKISISSLSSGFQTTSYHIDVRTVALRSFRDKVVLPLSARIYARLTMSNRQDKIPYQQPRLQQMLLVLKSQSGERPSKFSLTSPVPELTSGESAIADLLRVASTPGVPSSHRSPMAPLTRAPSFLSGGLPRDRRGRIAQKVRNLTDLGGMPAPGERDDDGLFGDETPRNGSVSHAVDREREREKEFLDALRGSDVDNSTARPAWVAGAWGRDLLKAPSPRRKTRKMSPWTGTKLK